MAKIDRDYLFATLRGSAAFPHGFTQPAVNGINAIVDEWEKRPELIDLRWLAYCLATARGEVGLNMQPVREGFAASDAGARTLVRNLHRSYAIVVNGHVYYGRGLVQLTWYDNYVKMGKLLGFDLASDPDKALIPTIAADIMFTGMTLGTFTGKKLADYISGTKRDYVGARRIINGQDRAQELASYASAFEKALRVKDVQDQPLQQPEPISPQTVEVPPVPQEPAVQPPVIVPEAPKVGWFKRALYAILRAIFPGAFDQ